MNRNEEPRWYEGRNPQPGSPQQPGWGQPVYDDFDQYPFLPTPEHTTLQHNGAPPAPPATPPSRLRHMLGQILVVGALVIVAFWAGWFCHQYLSNSFNASDQSKAYAQLVQDAWTKIDQNYVDRKNVNYKNMAYAAINGMVQTLNDPGHSRFEDPKTAQSENQDLSGKYTGIGIYLSQDPTTKKLVITAPIPGSPAEKAGLKHGDVITAINGVDMTGKDINAATALIEGTAGTNVTLTIQRPGVDKLLTFSVMRAEISVPNVLMYTIPGTHIVQIQVVQFASGVAGQVRDDVNQAKSQGATKIILDLRNNPGGYLNEAIDMASLFIKNGNVLLEQDSTGQRTPIPVNGNPIDTNGQMVVLVNKNSASAAEIVSGALKENNRATLIGEKTFGTGTVLESFPLADGSVLLLGTQEWLTPNGHFIRQLPNDPNSGGIQPNITVTAGTNDTILTPNAESSGNMTLQQILSGGDTQLNAAINYLNGSK